MATEGPTVTDQCRSPSAKGRNRRKTDTTHGNRPVGFFIRVRFENLVTQRGTLAAERGFFLVSSLKDLHRGSVSHANLRIHSGVRTADATLAHGRGFQRVANTIQC